MPNSSPAAPRLDFTESRRRFAEALSLAEHRMTEAYRSIDETDLDIANVQALDALGLRVLASAEYVAAVLRAVLGEVRR